MLYESYVNDCISKINEHWMLNLILTEIFLWNFEKRIVVYRSELELYFSAFVAYVSDKKRQGSDINKEVLQRPEISNKNATLLSSLLDITYM